VFQDYVFKVDLRTVLKQMQLVFVVGMLRNCRPLLTAYKFQNAVFIQYLQNVVFLQ